jgi:hypothetical protein
MNGRIYDYNLGRFLSVDPFIQAPGNSQSLNPYSYIMNNPLAGTDPTGYTSESKVPGPNKNNLPTKESCQTGPYQIYCDRWLPPPEDNGAKDDEASSDEDKPADEKESTSQNTFTPPTEAEVLNKVGEAIQAANPEAKKLIEEHGVMSGDRKLWGSSGHVYKNVDKICELESCSPADVNNGVKRFPAPGADGKSRIRMGGVTDVDLPGPVALFNGSDNVLHHVDDESMTVFNFTLGDHMLNPGWVMRQTFVKDGAVYVRTYGVGEGFNFGDVNGNQTIVDFVWEGTNDNIRNCISESNC